MDTVFTNGEVTPEMMDSFVENGFIIVRGLMTSEEVKKVCENVEQGDYLKNSFMVKDKEGNQSAQITWNFPGNDVLGLLARSQKVAGTCAKILGGEVYHYHSKLVIKDPHTGGQRAWHQDYGYWYNNGCLFPDMMTVFVAIDRVTKGNGCLQVLEGSHKAGRIEHGMSGGEQGANLERVEALKSACKLTYIEMEPGDALFFHCNLLHKSDVNTSDGRRLAFLPAYNKASNDPVKDSHHPRYNKLDMVSDKELGLCENYTDMTGKGFLDMANLKTLQNQVQCSKTN